MSETGSTPAVSLRSVNGRNRRKPEARDFAADFREAPRAVIRWAMVINACSLAGSVRRLSRNRWRISFIRQSSTRPKQHGRKTH